MEAEDLDLYFQERTWEEMIDVSGKLVDRYMTVSSSLAARKGPGSWKGKKGDAWDLPDTSAPPKDSTTAPEPFDGDDVLANSILRMRDSMHHYIFAFASTEGDIGWVLRILNVRTIYH